MKKIIITLIALTGCSIIMKAQSAIDAYNMSQPDLKGTARFMGMAGAFGALGGDLSTLSQNPAGIGVYRSSDIGFTLDLDIQNSTAQTDAGNFNMNQTKFLLNNIGAVLTMKLPSKTFPNFNFGFTYNKGASFNRVYGGNIGTLKNSMSNYIAGVANADGVTEGDVVSTNDYDPYEPGYNDYAAPWITILGYDSYLISPDLNPSTGETQWYGLWDTNSMTGLNTNGSGRFLMQEKGGVNEFNIAFGGNISNVLYWGMNFDIINLSYQLNSLWGESLINALVPANDGNFVRTSADWNLNNIYSVSGTGFNYQLGFIFKPVQPLRIGFAFHTPTWYSLSEEFGANVNYAYGGNESGTVYANNGYLGYNNYNLRTPWKIIASAAGVIGNNLIVSFDYEWANYGKMHLSEPTYYGDGWYDYPWDYYGSGSMLSSSFINPNDPYAYENYDISTYYKSSNAFRVGVEFKPISALSIRAGYSYVSSPVKQDVRNNREIIYTAGTQPSYRFDNDTNYITCGLGYRYQHVYIDLAYVYKNMSSEYHAFTPDPETPQIPSPQAKLTLKNNQIVLSAGYRF